MIALPATSQKRYTIDGDTIVGYTKQENRKIAIIFMQGDSCKDTSKETGAIISNLKASIESYKIIARTDSISKANLEGENKTLNKDLTKAKDTTIKADKSKQVWRGVAFIEAIAMTIILLLK